MDYNKKSLLQAKREIQKIDEFVGKLKGLSINETKRGRRNSPLVKNLISTAKNELEKAMDDNFNTPIAVASIFNLINKVKTLAAQNRLGNNDAKNILDFLQEIDKFFCFIFWVKIEQKIPKNILKLIEKRESYRQQKNWQKADEIRKKIKIMGWWVEDTEKGPIIKKIE